jgi:probable HAF family extracellular repeat protein
MKLCCLLIAAKLAATLHAQEVPTPERTAVTTEGVFTLIDYPDATSTQVWGINARGEMVGVYVSADRVTHGFLRSGGRFKSIDYPGAALTLANNINDRGDIVGEYATTPTGPHHGFLLSGGRFTTIDYPGSSSTAVVGIAANGDMVGLYDNPSHGFLLSGDTFTPIDFPGASPTVMGAISPQGDIVGGYALAGVSRAFLFRKGEFTTWEHPAANGFTNAIGRNAAGDTVGRYRNAAGVSTGYVLSNGQFTSFDYPGASFTGAAGIMPNGDIAGRCTVSGVNHGFLLKRGRHPRYKVTDLGTLGGNASIAYGINNAGAISGGANVASGDQHPFLWRDGRMSDLGGLGGANGSGSIPTGALHMAIASETAQPDPLGADFCGYGTHRICQAAIWKDGRFTSVPTLGGNNAIGYALNERGQMVGVAEKSTPDPTCIAPQKLRYAPVIWGPKAGDMQELPLPAGDTVGWAILINEKGEAVGATGTCDNTATSINGLLVGKRAVLWENGVARDLGNFGGDGDTVAIGINGRTEVTGASSVVGGGIHGFLWSRENGMEDVGSLGDDPAGLPSSINNARQMVGASCDADFNCRAFLWENYSMTDLNDLVAEDSPIYMVFATWINDVGQIVGWGIDKQTEEVRAFLASPVRAETLSKASSPLRILPHSARTRVKSYLRK